MKNNQTETLVDCIGKLLTISEGKVDAVADELLDGGPEDLVVSGSRFTVSPHEENEKDLAFKSAHHSILKCAAQVAPLIDFLSTFNYKESERTEAFISGSLPHWRVLVTNVTLELSKAQELINSYKELVDTSDVQIAQMLLQSMVDFINIENTAINTIITRHNDFFNNEVSYHVDNVHLLSFV